MTNLRRSAHAKTILPLTLIIEICLVLFISQVKSAGLSITNARMSTSLSEEFSPSSVYFGDSVNITATLLDEDGNPLQNQSIGFSAHTLEYIADQIIYVGYYICSAVTDSSGKTTVQFTLDNLEYCSPFHPAWIKAEYSGNENYEPSEAHVHPIVDSLDTILTLDIPNATYGEMVTLNATLKNEKENTWSPSRPLSDSAIEFRVYNGTVWSSLGFVVPDSHGVASVNYDPPTSGIFPVEAFFIYNEEFSFTPFKPSNATGLLVVSPRAGLYYTQYYYLFVAMLIAVLGVPIYIIYRETKGHH